MKKTIAFLLFTLATLSALPTHAEDVAALFPFPISHDAQKNITNVASWENTAWREVPAGRDGFVRVEDGHFVNDRGRVRIWGTNFCTSANLPTKEEAERVAARLARFGINCVRVHHLDSSNIFGVKPKSLLNLDPEQIDKLDYLVYQLKSQGIYIDMNLHCSRTMDDRDGFPGKEGRPRYDKGVDNFYPALIDVQKKYAKNLLTHVNPYTKTAYKDEPTVAVVEINNENSVVREWTYGKELLNLPEPYAAEFRKQWNDYLKRKYKSTVSLSEAWKCRSVPLGDEMFSKTDENKKWAVETGPEAQFEKTGSGNVMRLKVDRIGRQTRHPQLIAKNMKFKEGEPYTFSFRVKSDKPSKVTIMARMGHDPWQHLGFFRVIDVTDQWQTLAFTFLPRETDDNARFDITYFSPGLYEFSDSSLKPGGRFGLEENETLEAGTIPIVAKNDTRLPKGAIDDFCEFLFEIEKKYWTDMYRFLKDEIGVRQPVSGTQLYYGSTTTQAELDYIDVHRYWNHPHFPGVRWDRKNWWLRNRALVDNADKEIFPPLATARVHGKPYTVSEYDSPFPNEYSAEALPMLAAFGAFQDWDGIFHFAYSHSRETFGKNLVTGYFDMVGNPAKLAHLHACIAMFRRGDISKAPDLVLGGFDTKAEFERFKKDRDCRNFNFSGIGLDPRLALFHRTALDLSGRTTAPLPTVGDDDLWTMRKQPRSGQLFWDKSPRGRVFTACSEHSILFTGFTPDLPAGKTFQPYVGEDVELHLNGDTRLGWQTISLVSVDMNGFKASGRKDGKPVRILVAATGSYENTGMKLEKLEDDKVTMSLWGTAPVLCEGIPFTLRFRHAEELRCFPLDENGNRRDPIATTGHSVRLKPEYRTVWYEVELLASPVQRLTDELKTKDEASKPK